VVLGLLPKTEQPGEAGFPASPRRSGSEAGFQDHPQKSGSEVGFRGWVPGPPSEVRVHVSLMLRTAVLLGVWRKSTSFGNMAAYMDRVQGRKGVNINT